MQKSAKQRRKRHSKVQTKVEVLGVPYAIRLVPGEEIDNDHGQCDVECTTIRVSIALSPDARKRVLSHEIAHAAIWESGFHATLRRTLSSEQADWLEEQMLLQFLPAFISAKVSK